MGTKLGMRGLSLLVVGWRSPSSAVGFVVGLSLGARDTTPNRDFHDSPDTGRLLSRQHKTQTEVVWDGYSAWRYARRLRGGQPGFSGAAEGSGNPMIVCLRGERAGAGRARTDCESLLVRRVPAWSIACTCDVSLASVMIEYGFVSVLGALKMNVS